MSAAQPPDRQPILGQPRGSDPEISPPRWREGRIWDVTEIIVVVAALIAPWTIAGLGQLALQVTGTRSAPDLGPTFATLPWLNSVWDVLYWTVATMPAPLVVLLILRSGRGLADMGIRRPGWIDVIGGVALFLVAGVGAASAGSDLLGMVRNVGVFNYPHSNDVLDHVGDSLHAGITEETILLGYLVVRLRGLGLAVWKIALVTLGIRTSYHLYYGTEALTSLMFGAVQTIFFLRYRRLLPVVGAHVAWDIYALS